MTTPTEDLGIHNIDNYEHQNYQPPRDYINKLYHETEQLAEILNLNGDTKFDIDMYENSNCIWNIEDYFTI
jgi:hypothetical protein